MKNENKVLAWTWELSQTLCAMLLLYVVNAGASREYNALVRDAHYYKVSRGLFGAGVCLGEWIFFDAARSVSLADVLHEFGHKKQSRLLGWLYLPVVGLPSLVRNVYDRIAHGKWLPHERARWYYGGWPESWADRLGGVERGV